MIYFNGQRVPPEKGLTIARLLGLMGREARLTVVTVDDKFVPPAEYNKFIVNDGAKVAARELHSGG